MALVTEKVDERILRLLGLEFVFDLDYGTYLSLLNGAIVAGKNKLPAEELALLSNEKKRIGRKQGRFKPKKQKITADKIATTKFLKPSVQPISSPLAAPSQVQAPQVQSVDLSPLQEPLESIKNTLSQFLSFRKGSDEQERRGYEAQRRSKREAILENTQKGMSAVSNAVQTFISPFQGIMDRIWRFIFFTLLGRTFTQLIDWFKDPNNTKKVETLQRFFKDWWPTLLGAAVLFFTPFGRFVRGVLRIVGGLTGKLVAQIPKIGGAINALRLVVARHPLLASLAIGTAAVAGAVTYFNQQQKKEAESPEEVDAQQQVQQFSSGGSILKSLFGINQVSPYTQLFGYGGITNDTGHRVSGFGPDTQLIAAQPGEIVINKRTVDAVGADTFLTMNRYYGGPGANQPKMGRMFNTGGQVQSQRSLIPGQSNSRQPENPKENAFKGYYDILKSFGVPFPEVAAVVVTESKNASPKNNNLLNIPEGDSGEEQKKYPSVRKFFQEVFAHLKLSGHYRRSYTPMDAFENLRINENIPPLDPNKFISGMLDIGINPDLPKSLPTTKSKEKDKKQEPGYNPLKPNNEEEKSYSQSSWNPFHWFNDQKKKNDKDEGQEQPQSNPFSLLNLSAVQKKKDGGTVPITNNTGFNIPSWAFPGAGIDSQFVSFAAQPKEQVGVLTRTAVENGAVPAFENLLAQFDPNSNPAKSLNYRADPKIPEIKPLNRGNGGVTYLPDIVQSASGGTGGAGAGGGPQVPLFSAISPKSSRATQIVIYGIKSA
jgi:hypothetical protein